MSKIKCARLRRGSGSGAASADLVLVRSCFRRFASLFFRHAPARVIFRDTNRLRSSARSGLRVGPAMRFFCAIPPSFSWQSGRHPQGLRPPECGRQWPGQEDRGCPLPVESLSPPWGRWTCPRPVGWRTSGWGQKCGHILPGHERALAARGQVQAHVRERRASEEGQPEPAGREVDTGAEDVGPWAQRAEKGAAGDGAALAVVC